MNELIIISILLGVSLGSFINVCIYRLPKEISLVNRRSFCPKCGHQLRWLEMVPVISYIIIKGKCRYCNEKISLQYQIIELLVGTVAFLVVIHSGISLQSIEFLFYFLLMLIVAVIDWKHFIIPNQIIIIGLVGGFIFKSIAGRELFIDALIGSLSAFTILFLIRIFGDIFIRKPSMGWGDVKLVAVIGLFIGLQSFLISLWLAAIIGSIYGISAMRKEPKTADLAIAPSGMQLGSVQQIPLGAFLGGVSVMIFFFQPFIKSIINSWLILNH